MSYNEKGYIAAGSAELEARSDGLGKLVQDGYFSGCFWICENAHEFAKNDIVVKRECPVCKTKLVRWVPKRIE